VDVQDVLLMDEGCGAFGILQYLPYISRERSICGCSDAESTETRVNLKRAEAVPATPAIPLSSFATGLVFTSPLIHRFNSIMNILSESRDTSR
jgi:hypothetical protein